MNVKALVPIIAAVFMGVIAAVLARHAISSHGPAAARVHTVRVAVAKADIPPGHAITAEDLVLAPIAAAAPPPNAFADTAPIVGRVTRAPMLAGEPVLESLLAPAGVPDGLQALVPEGMRAITLETTESSGLAGLLSPGARVDVVTTATTANDAERAVSRIIAQNVRVLAVGARLGNPTPGQPEAPATPASRTVTLLVTPHDAAALDLAQTMARLRLILRGSGDTQQVDDDAVMLAELRGNSSVIVPVLAPATTQPASDPQPQPQPQPHETLPVAQPAAPTTMPADPPRHVVRLILGGKEQRLTFREQPKAGEPALTDTADAKDPFASP